MIRGERFELDLDDGGEQDGPQRDTSQQSVFVGDVLERQTATAVPPTAPTLKSKSGFPQHQKRNVQSRFKQQHTQVAPEKSLLDVNSESRDAVVAARPGANQNSKAGKTWEEEEKQRIDQENRQKLAQMSSQEIEAERQDLMNSLSPALLQRLLQRSTIDSGTAEADLSQADSPTQEKTKKPGVSNTKTVSFAEPVEDEEEHAATEVSKDIQTDNLEAPITEPLVNESIHFPRPPQPPDLDPSSATFFTDLHDKYFPSLPSDPDKLEWMQPSSTPQTKNNNSYSPTASTLQAKDLRFSFKGDLIPPKLAAEIPVTAGLHHHGDAPDAAGYTIPELAHLAQSSVPAQRCIAFQTLGRILYRLGKGEFGDSGEPGGDEDINRTEDTLGELARGLWATADKENVIEILMRESEGNGVDRGRHVSAKAYATEAVWLWRKGGGRTWKAG